LVNLIVQIESEIQELQLSFIHKFQNSPHNSL
jgi:hypothetical protein